MNLRGLSNRHQKSFPRALISPEKTPGPNRKCPGVQFELVEDTPSLTNEGRPKR